MPATINPDTIVSTHPDHLSAEIDGELVIMSVADGKYVALNAIATAVWQRLGQPVRVSKLCADLARDYDGDGAVIAQDVQEMLQCLSSLGLIAVHRETGL